MKVVVAWRSAESESVDRLARGGEDKVKVVVSWRSAESESVDRLARGGGETKGGRCMKEFRIRVCRQTS